MATDKAFNKIAENHLEEWIIYLKDGVIDEDTTAPGLQEAKRKLDYMSMNAAEKHAYGEHINAVMIQNDVISTAIKEGRAEGRAKVKLEMARNMKADGMPTEMIQKYTGLSAEEIEGLV